MIIMIEIPSNINSIAILKRIAPLKLKSNNFCWLAMIYRSSEEYCSVSNWEGAVIADCQLQITVPPSDSSGNTFTMLRKQFLDLFIDS